MEEINDYIQYDCNYCYNKNIRGIKFSCDHFLCAKCCYLPMVDNINQSNNINEVLYNNKLEFCCIICFNTSISINTENILTLLNTNDSNNKLNETTKNNITSNTINDLTNINNIYNVNNNINEDAKIIECESCEDKNSDVYCIECNIMFCNDCLCNYHNKIKKNKKHTLDNDVKGYYNLNNCTSCIGNQDYFTLNNSIKTNKIELSFTSKNDNNSYNKTSILDCKKAEFFCIDCKEEICLKCSYDFKHSNHSILNIRTNIKQLKQQIYSNLIYLNKYLNSINSLNNNVNCQKSKEFKYHNLNIYEYYLKSIDSINLLSIRLIKLRDYIKEKLLIENKILETNYCILKHSINSLNEKAIDKQASYNNYKIENIISLSKIFTNGNLNYQDILTMNTNYKTETYNLLEALQNRIDSLNQYVLSISESYDINLYKIMNSVDLNKFNLNSKFNTEEDINESIKDINNKEEKTELTDVKISKEASINNDILIDKLNKNFIKNNDLNKEQLAMTFKNNKYIDSLNICNTNSNDCIINNNNNSTLHEPENIDSNVNKFNSLNKEDSQSLDLLVEQFIDRNIQESFNCSSNKKIRCKNLSYSSENLKFEVEENNNLFDDNKNNEEIKKSGDNEKALLNNNILENGKEQSNMEINANKSNSKINNLSSQLYNSEISTLCNMSDIQTDINKRMGLIDIITTPILQYKLAVYSTVNGNIKVINILNNKTACNIISNHKNTITKVKFILSNNKTLINELSLHKKYNLNLFEDKYDILFICSIGLDCQAFFYYIVVNSINNEFQAEFYKGINLNYSISNFLYVNSESLSFDYKEMLVFGSNQLNKQIKIYDFQTLEFQKSIQLLKNSFVNCLCFYENNDSKCNYLLIGDEKNLSVYELEYGKLYKNFKTKGLITSMKICFYNNKHTLIYIDDTGIISTREINKWNNYFTIDLNIPLYDICKFAYINNDEIAFFVCGSFKGIKLVLSNKSELKLVENDDNNFNDTSLVNCNNIKLSLNNIYVINITNFNFNGSDKIMLITSLNELCYIK